MSRDVFSFKVTFKPRSSWVDKVYLGNMLAEVLGVMAKNTSAFEFEIEYLQKEEKE